MPPSWENSSTYYDLLTTFTTDFATLLTLNIVAEADTMSNLGSTFAVY